MGRFVAFINELCLDDLAKVGGKGANLGELTRAGFMVPPAFCIIAESFDIFLKVNNLDEPISEIASNIDFSKQSDIEEKTSHIRSLITSADIPRDMAVEITDGYERLYEEGRTPLVAVRSSVGTRDLSRSSFPGQMSTFHNIMGAQEVLLFVRECWASLWNVRAASILHDKQVDHGMVFIAPIVQSMVQAETAGVIFTSNPVDGNNRELIINASYGLGEAVVSGNITPDHYVVCKEAPEILKAEPGSKGFKVELDTVKGCGNRKISLSEDETVRECLRHEQIMDLAEIGIKAEEHYRRPQDIEWAYAGGELYVLQSRDVKEMQKSQDAEEIQGAVLLPDDPENIWTRKFGDEYLADYITPLSRALLVRWIVDYTFVEILEIMGRDDLKEIEPIRFHQGYAYMSGLYIARMLCFLPRRLRSVKMLNYFPQSFDERFRAEPFKPGYIWGCFRLIWKDRRAPITKNEGALKSHCSSINRIIVPKLWQDYTELSEEEWQNQFEEVYEFGREHFRVIRWGMGYNMILHAILQRILRRWTGDEKDELYQAIISGLPWTKTVEINHDIWKLSQAARSDEGITDMLKEDSITYNEVCKASANPQFLQIFDGFLKCHGHRAATREIVHPRWRETPDIILGLVRAQLNAKESTQDPEKAIATSMKRRQDAEREALSKAGRGLFGSIRQRMLRWLFQMTQAYTCYRENQRYHLDYLLTHVRLLLLERGRRLAERGVLEEPSEVFFLEPDEFWQLFSDPVPSDDLRCKIQDRRNHYLRWKDRLPATYLYDDVETEGELLEDRPDVKCEEIKGMGASRGHVYGKARVITKLKDLNRVEQGEILITSNIDPGWTSVFPLIIGIVTETGGLLSHGALLAREYGIPAIMSVQNATQKINTGEFIEINGSSGIINLTPNVKQSTS